MHRNAGDHEEQGEAGPDQGQEEAQLENDREDGEQTQRADLVGEPDPERRAAIEPVRGHGVGQRVSVEPAQSAVRQLGDPGGEIDQAEHPLNQAEGPPGHVAHGRLARPGLESHCGPGEAETKQQLVYRPPRAARPQGDRPQGDRHEGLGMMKLAIGIRVGHEQRVRGSEKQQARPGEGAEEPGHPGDHGRYPHRVQEHRVRARARAAKGQEEQLERGNRVEVAPVDLGEKMLVLDAAPETRADLVAEVRGEQEDELRGDQDDADERQILEWCGSEPVIVQPAEQALHRPASAFHSALISHGVGSSPPASPTRIERVHT